MSWHRERITNLVSQTKLFLAQFHASTEAFSDTEALIVEFTCELEANATQYGVRGAVYVKTSC